MKKFLILVLLLAPFVSFCQVDAMKIKITSIEKPETIIQYRVAPDFKLIGTIDEKDTVIKTVWCLNKGFDFDKFQKFVKKQQSWGFTYRNSKGILWLIEYPWSDKYMVISLNYPYVN